MVYIYIHMSREAVTDGIYTINMSREAVQYGCYILSICPLARLLMEYVMTGSSNSIKTDVYDFSFSGHMDSI